MLVREGIGLAIALTMFAMGILLGFVGAGGAGFIIALLTVLFGVPIHTALGTSLAAMAFTTLSGAYSHFRQGNISLKTGLLTGTFGAIGSYFGSRTAGWIPVNSLHWLTAGMLFLSAVVLLIRLFIVQKRFENRKNELAHIPWILPKAVLVGTLSGILAGTFGIGSAPFIQIGLLTVLGLSIKQSVGTTMLVILPIAFAGGIGYYAEGYLDVVLLFQVLIGTMTGSYIGARFTNYAPQGLLKSAMVLTPITAAAIMLIS